MTSTATPQPPGDHRIAINTSWDDGPLEDLKLAALLKSHDVPAIYFLPAANPQRPCLDRAGIRELAALGEIGSHSYNHVALTSIPLEQCREELRTGKQFLEDVIGAPVDTFCYPWGDYNAAVSRVASGYFKSARLANIMSLRAPTSFHWDATFHLTYRKKTNLIKEILTHAPLALKPRLLAAVVGDYRLIDIVEMMLQYAVSHPGESHFLHFWGHSWEIEKYGLWDELRDICKLLQDYRAHFRNYTAGPA